MASVRGYYEHMHARSAWHQLRFPDGMVSCQVAETGGERTVDNFAAVVPRGQVAFASSPSRLRLRLRSSRSRVHHACSVDRT